MRLNQLNGVSLLCSVTDVNWLITVTNKEFTHKSLETTIANFYAYNFFLKKKSCNFQLSKNKYRYTYALLCSQKENT